MSKTAVLYDIHGNLRALDAVLAHAHAAGAGSFVLGGDYALFGPEPAETVALLRGLGDAVWIRGNVDRWCAHPDQAGEDELLQRAIADCAGALGEELAGALGGLPEHHVQGETRFCHASPISDMRSFGPDPGEADEELLAGVGERRIVFGHTHLQFHRPRPDGVELVNPGSVGMPLDGDPRAAYALMGEDGTLTPERVPYDHQAAATAVGERFGRLPWAQRSERRLRCAAP
ncbi:MAG: metallophosphatase family protein [Actinomycetota bacterium]|nr:metallophosphatase family protein [Actinomycetota bacterium]